LWWWWWQRSTSSVNLIQVPRFAVLFSIAAQVRSVPATPHWKVSSRKKERKN
jgi:hypothetical protein